MDPQSLKSEAARRFGEAAKAYRESKGHGDREALAKLVEIAEPNKSDRVLDVASGTGHVGLEFAPHVQEVVLHDLSEGMLAQAAEEAAARGMKNVQTRIGDAENLPFEDGTFDLVTCRLAGHHFPDQARFFKEAARVLKPGGKLLFVDNFAPDTPGLREEIFTIEKLRDWTHVQTWKISEMLDQIERAGMRVLRTVESEYTEPIIAHRSSRIGLDEWVKRIGTPPEDVERIQTLFHNASDALRKAYRIQIEGAKIEFVLPKVSILARRPEQAMS